MKKKLKPSNFKETAGPVVPTAPSQRIVSIDVLRGFALLGILASNIRVFAMVYAVVCNPTISGDFTGGNYVVAMLTQVLVSSKFYPLFSMLFGVGVPFRFFYWICNSLHNWDVWFPPGPTRFIYWETILRNAVYFLIPLGYIGGIMLICRSGRLRRLSARLAAVGRMALTNYLMHSAICSFIFFGYGLGLFGKVDRMGQLLVVLLIWVFQLWFSPLWLKHFRFGPIEWMWRSLTYWKIQPMKIRTKSA